MAKPITSLVGNKYSRLTVESQAPNRQASPTSKARVYWNCVCDCGNRLEVRQDGLTGGGTQSCGCYKDDQNRARRGIKLTKYTPRTMEDLVGRSFGRLTVISKGKTSTTPKGRTLNYWTCGCLCGTIKDIESGQLRQGKIKSCGCVPPDFIDSDFMSKTDLFISRAVEINGDKYDYSLVEFKHSQENIKIICKVHGVFEQQPSNHLMGGGCKACGYDSRSHTLDSFIEKAINIHGTTYDYSLVDFKSSKERVEIVCKEHGVFTQKPNEHLSGRGCQVCGQLRKFVGLDDFIKRSNEVHNYKFDYSNSVYEHSNSKIEIFCKTHGSFFQKAGAHLLGHQCPKCSGEERALKQHWNYLTRCKLNEELANSKGYLYLLEIKSLDEVFIKIGISTNYKKRIARYLEEGLSFNVLKVIETTSVESAIFERKLLNYIKNNDLRFIPTLKFKGWTECAVLPAKDNLLVEMEKLDYDG